MADKHSADPFLDDLFAEARQANDDVPADLLARVLEDGYGMQDTLAAPVEIVAPRRSVWRVVSDALGGWPAVAGLAAAGVAGVWIGVAPPDVVSSEVASVLGIQAELVAFDLDEEVGFFDDFLAEDI